MSRRYLILADRSLDAQIREILGLSRQASTRRAAQADEQNPFAGYSPNGSSSREIVIINSFMLSRYKSRGGARLHDLLNGRKLLVVVTERTITNIIAALQMADGIVFQHSNIRHLPMILALMEEGHMSVPSDILSILLERGLRRKILLSLSGAEQRALSLLGHGCTNNIIAATLDISEGRAKYLIRSLLKKLLLQNRTQAAVFAAREIKLIDAPAPNMPPQQAPAVL